MLFSQNKIFIKSNIDIYVSNSGRLYVRGPLGILSNKLFFSFDLTQQNLVRSLRGVSLKQLFSFLKFGISSVTFGYYAIIDLIGLGYRIKKITRMVYRFYLGQSHFIYVYIPSSILFWAFQNKITLFSIYADRLFSISTNIMLLRKLNAYKLRGLVRPGQIIVLKEGKQR